MSESQLSESESEYSNSEDNSDTILSSSGVFSASSFNSESSEDSDNVSTDYSNSSTTDRSNSEILSDSSNASYQSESLKSDKKLSKSLKSDKKSNKRNKKNKNKLIKSSGSNSNDDDGNYKEIPYYVNQSRVKKHKDKLNYTKPIVIQNYKAHDNIEKYSSSDLDQLAFDDNSENESLDSIKNSSLRKISNRDPNNTDHNTSFMSHHSIHPYLQQHSDYIRSLPPNQINSFLSQIPDHVIESRSKYSPPSYKSHSNNQSFNHINNNIQQLQKQINDLQSSISTSKSNPNVQTFNNDKNNDNNQTNQSQNNVLTTGQLLSTLKSEIQSEISNWMLNNNKINQKNDNYVDKHFFNEALSDLTSRVTKAISNSKDISESLMKNTIKASTLPLNTAVEDLSNKMESLLSRRVENKQPMEDIKSSIQTLTEDVKDLTFQSKSLQNLSKTLEKNSTLQRNSIPIESQLLEFQQNITTQVEENSKTITNAFYEIQQDAKNLLEKTQKQQDSIDEYLHRTENKSSVLPSIMSTELNSMKQSLLDLQAQLQYSIKKDSNPSTSVLLEALSSVQEKISEIFNHQLSEHTKQNFESIQIQNSKNMQFLENSIVELQQTVNEILQEFDENRLETISLQQVIKNQKEVDNSELLTVNRAIMESFSDLRDQIQDILNSQPAPSDIKSNVLMWNEIEEIQEKLNSIIQFSQLQHQNNVSSYPLLPPTPNQPHTNDSKKNNTTSIHSSHDKSKIELDQDSIDEDIQNTPNINTNSSTISWSSEEIDTSVLDSPINKSKDEKIFKKKNISSNSNRKYKNKKKYHCCCNKHCNQENIHNKCNHIRCSCDHSVDTSNIQNHFCPYCNQLSFFQKNNQPLHNFDPSINYTSMSTPSFIPEKNNINQNNHNLSGHVDLPLENNIKIPDKEIVDNKNEILSPPLELDTTKKNSDNDEIQYEIPPQAWWLPLEPNTKKENEKYHIDEDDYRGGSLITFSKNSEKRSHPTRVNSPNWSSFHSKCSSPSSSHNTSSNRAAMLLTINTGRNNNSKNTKSDSKTTVTQLDGGKSKKFAKEKWKKQRDELENWRKSHSKNESMYIIAKPYEKSENS